jgi:hypothetical protein
LEQLKRGIVTVQPKDTGDDDIVLLKQKVGIAIYKSQASVLFISWDFVIKKFWIKVKIQNVNTYC